MDHNQEGQPASTTSNKGNKTKKSTSEAPPHPGPSTGPSAGPRNDSTLRNLGTGRPTIQCTVCGEYSHWRRECPYHVPCGTPKSLRRDQQANSEILGNAMGRTAPTGANTQGHLPQPQSQRSNAGMSTNTGHNNRSSQYYRNYNYDYRESQRQPHTRFDERYNQRYSPPVFPPTPSLNSSIPEALSKSFLQIAENQSRTIEAMKASQEAQAAAYKEMTKTNKMIDDDALFHSIEVHYGSNATKFEKWIDSIDQATCITGRDLRRVAEKIRWCHQKYTIDDG